MLKNCSKINFIVLCVGIFVAGIFLGVLLYTNVPALELESPPPSLTLPSELIEAETEKAQEMIIWNAKFRTYCDTGKGNEKCIGNIGNVLLGILDQNGNLITSVMTNENGTAETVISVPSDMRFMLNETKSMRGTITIVALKKGYVPKVLFDVRVGSGGQYNLSISMDLAVGDLRLDESQGMRGDHFYRLEVSLVVDNVAKMLNFDIR